jgi:hypothetical protein
MAHVLEKCDPDTYADVHGQLERGNEMVDEYYYLINNDTWDLFP